MRSQPLLLALTVINALLLVFLLAGTPIAATSESSVLRGRALEIVDERGRIRASIKIQAADENVRMPDGSRGYPETVILRLIDPTGGPHVKLQSNVRGAGILLGGESDPTYATLGATGGESRLRLKNKDGRERVIVP